MSSLSLNLTMTITNSSSIIMPLLLGICLSLIALITALGNIVVLLAFYCEKKLRTINDYFILNMAIADFLIGSFCIPFYIPFSITQSWPFGRIFCKIWVTIDDVTTMASVINIVAISINRYWSIAYPLSYRKYVKQHFVYSVMGGVWCLSFINFAPGIWLLSLFSEESNLNNVSRTDCSGDYNNSFVYMLIAQFNYFIWPFIVLCVLNMLLMLNIWKRSRKMTGLRTFHLPVKMKEENIGSSALGTSKDFENAHHQHFPKEKVNLINRYPSIIPEERENILQRNSLNPNLRHLFNQEKVIQSLSNNSPDRINDFLLRKSVQVSSPRIHYSTSIDIRHSSPILSLTRKSVNSNRSISRNNRSDSMINDPVNSEIEISKGVPNEFKSSDRSKKACRHVQMGQSRIVRDRKAARSLFILVIVFLLFLFPYVICATASTAGINISTFIFEISFWLLWLNSMCNPFLYPFIQMKYRRAYEKVFDNSIKYFTFKRSNRLTYV